MERGLYSFRWIGGRVSICFPIAPSRHPPYIYIQDKHNSYPWASSPRRKMISIRQRAPFASRACSRRGRRRIRRRRRMRQERKDIFEINLDESRQLPCKEMLGVYNGQSNAPTVSLMEMDSRRARSSTRTYESPRCAP